MISIDPFFVVVDLRDLLALLSFSLSYTHTYMKIYVLHALLEQIQQS